MAGPDQTPAPSKRVFAIFGGLELDSTSLNAAVEKVFGEADRFQLPNNAWLVAFQGSTSSQVYEAIQTELGRGVTCIVVPMEKYYGWHDAAIWQWVESERGGV